MASKQSNVDFVLDQMEGAGLVSARKMFGEYAIYCQGKVVALFCDDQLFVKPTVAGKRFIGQVVEGSPYPGSKPWYLVTGDQCEDSDWLAELTLLTANELPLPKPKPPKREPAQPKASKKRAGKKVANKPVAKRPPAKKPRAKKITRRSRRA